MPEGLQKKAWNPGSDKETCSSYKSGTYVKGSIDTRILKDPKASALKKRILDYFPDTSKYRVSTLCYNKRKTEVSKTDEATPPLEVHLRAGNPEYVFLLLEKKALNILDKMSDEERLAKIRYMSELAKEGDKKRRGDVSVETIYLEGLFKKRLFEQEQQEYNEKTKQEQQEYMWRNERRRKSGVDWYTLYKFHPGESTDMNDGVNFKACISDVDCVFKNKRDDHQGLPVCCLDGGNPLSPRGKCKNASKCNMSVLRARATIGGMKPIDMLDTMTRDRPFAVRELADNGFDPRQNKETMNSKALKPLDQGKCETCWAHSTATGISHHLFVKTGGIANFVLSAQEISQRTLFPGYYKLTKKSGMFSNLKDKPEHLPSLAKELIKEAKRNVNFAGPEVYRIFKTGNMGAGPQKYWKTLATGNGVFPRLCYPYRCRIASKGAKKHWLDATQIFLRHLFKTRLKTKREMFKEIPMPESESKTTVSVPPLPSENDIPSPESKGETSVSEWKLRARDNWKRITEAFTSTLSPRENFHDHADLNQGILVADAYVGLPKNEPELGRICRKEITRVKLEKKMPFVNIAKYRQLRRKPSCVPGTSCTKRIGNNYFNNPHMPYKGFENGPFDNYMEFEYEVMNTLKEHGSIVLAINENFYDTDLYKVVDGVFIPQTIFPDVNHSVTLVGWGETESKIPYWLFINSWGELWNGDGYFKVQRGISESCANEYTDRWQVKIDDVRSNAETESSRTSYEEVSDSSSSLENSLSPGNDIPAVRIIEDETPATACGLDFFMAHASTALEHISLFGVRPVIRAETITSIMKKDKRCEKDCVNGILRSDCSCLCEDNWEDTDKESKTGCDKCSIVSCPPGERLNNSDGKCLCECEPGLFGFGCSLSTVVGIGKYQCPGDKDAKYLLFLELKKDEKNFKQAIKDGDDDEMGALLCPKAAAKNSECEYVDEIEKNVLASVEYISTNGKDITVLPHEYQFHPPGATAIYRFRDLPVGMDAANIGIQVPLGFNELGQNKGTTKVDATYLKEGTENWEENLHHQCGGRSRQNVVGFIPAILGESSEV